MGDEETREQNSGSPDAGPKPLRGTDSETHETKQEGQNRPRRPDPEKIGPGSVVADRYEVEERIGEGGAGVVFRVFDRALGEVVAMKILRHERAGDRSWIRRLAREVKVARAVRHPNVCRVFEFAKMENLWFVTMELASGTLREDFQRRDRALAAMPLAKTTMFRRLSRDVRRQIDPREQPQRLADARAVCAGLAAIHALGVIHRDVTPQNVLRTADGRLVVSDFGLAVKATELTTFHGGTPAFMAPEVLAGDVATEQSDVWQLGLLLHNLVFGRKPEWERKGDRLRMKPPVPATAPAVEVEIARLCALCLSQDPRARPVNAVAVAGLLAAAEAARPKTLVERTATRMRGLISRRDVRAVVVGAICLALVTAVVRISQRTRPCEGGPDRVADAWNSTRREAVRKSFIESGGVNGAAVFATTSQILNNYLLRWLQSYKDACEATQVRGDQSSEVLDLRMACLTDELSSVKALTTVLAQADKTVVENAQKAVTSLGDVGLCDDVTQLRARVALPKDSQRRELVVELRRRVAKAKALAAVGRMPSGQVEIEPAVKAARNVGDGPTLAEALSVYGNIKVGLGDVTGWSTLEEAVWIGQASGNDRAVAEAATALVFPHGQDLALLEQWAALAESTLRRIGGDKVVESWYWNNLGGLQIYRGQLLASVNTFQRALDMKIALLGPEHYDVGMGHGNLGAALASLDRFDESMAQNDRAIEIMGKVLASDDPELGVQVCNRAALLLAKQKVTEARVDFEGCLRLVERRPGNPNGAYAQWGLAEIARQKGRLSDAAELFEQAKRLAPDTGDLMLLADIDFGLARCKEEKALVDRRRLAEEAEATFCRADGPGATRKCSEVRAWLAAQLEAKATDSPGMPLRLPRSASRQSAEHAGAKR